MKVNENTWKYMKIHENKWKNKWKINKVFVQIEIWYLNDFRNIVLFVQGSKS